MHLNFIEENGMYFWNTTKLIDDLKNNQLTEENFKNYYIVSGILMLLLFFIGNQAPAEEIKIGFALCLVNIGLLISWVNAIFKANGGHQGQQFLNRFVALYLPITIRVFVCIMLIFLVVEFFLIKMLHAYFEPEQMALMSQIIATIFDLMMSCMVYWRIYVGIKKINAV